MTNPGDLSKDTDLTVVVHIGSFSASAGVITITTPPNLLVILIPVFAGLFMGLILIIVVICISNQRIKNKKRKLTYEVTELKHRTTDKSLVLKCK